MEEIINKYCSYLGRLMNYELVNKNSGEYLEQILELQNILKNAAPLKNDITVFRYIDDYEMQCIEKSGRIYISPIFLSTTKFLSTNGYNGKSNLLELHLYQGTKGIFSDNITGRTEGEFILPYGTKILIHHIVSVNTVKKCLGSVQWMEQVNT